jgi:hypothetical protein
MQLFVFDKPHWQSAVTLHRAAILLQMLSPPTSRIADDFFVPQQLVRMLGKVPRVLMKLSEVLCRIPVPLKEA